MHSDFKPCILSRKMNSDYKGDIQFYKKLLSISLNFLSKSLYSIFSPIKSIFSSVI